MIDNFETKTTCPLCRTDMVMKWQKDTIPYFGDIMFTTAVCDSCTFRFSDTLILNSKDPVCYSLPIRSLSDLDARVIRSSSGTIIIEELGIMVEPGPISESYVSNAEGVLQRIRSVVVSAVRWSEGDEEKVARGTELLRQIDEIIDNPKTATVEITLQIKDPLGNSAILSANATSKKLTQEELGDLKTGMIVLDVEKDEIIHDISDAAGPLGNKNDE